MPEIKVLDRNIAELIAAGEVIERPASVIKEIVENSIDAGAKRITVEIKNGGVTYMRVTDDGCGIAHSEVPTAFLRHATSKLTTASDLECIYTMGFRGEALASIAAVARVEILTKRADDALGTSFKIEGGEQTDYSENGCPNGTTIIIRDLFFNTPARLKFMKKDVTEGNSVQSVVDKLALAHPEISFRFIRDNKQVRLTTGDGKYYSAVYAVFGKQFAASLTPVDFSYNGTTVSGFVSTPHFCRANRAMQYFFVNSRSIRNLTCMAALEEGYRNCVMTGKFPACVLNIEINPQEVDVNVSPSKTDVKFANERAVFEAVYMATKNAILNAENSREIKLPEVKTDEHIEARATVKNTVVASEIPAPEPPPEKPYNREFAVENADTAAQEEPEIVDMKRLRASRPIYAPVPPVVLYTQEKIEQESVKADEKPFEINPYKFLNAESFENKNSERQKCEPAPIVEEKPEKNENLRVVGEIFKTYIVCECGDEMLLIDKHAAHERIRFEQLKKDFMQSGQLLAESAFATLSPEEWSAVCEHTEILADMGIDVICHENFQVEITTMPTLLTEARPAEILQKAAQMLMNYNENALGEMFDDMLHTFACKGAIKAHDTTSLYELETLAKRVWEDESLRYCPHGRPIITNITKTTLEKSFKRIV